MSLLLILMAVFFGMVLWCTAPRLLRLLGAAAARRETAASARLSFRVRTAGD